MTCGLPSYLTRCTYSYTGQAVPKHPGLTASVGQYVPHDPLQPKRIKQCPKYFWEREKEGKEREGKKGKEKGESTRPEGLTLPK